MIYSTVGKLSFSQLLNVEQADIRERQREGIEVFCMWYAWSEGEVDTAEDTAATDYILTVTV